MSALEGASKYLNNLLLARGLLQNGKSINFAHPEKGADGIDATMSKIINLVHDLVLRRDRDAEQQETMMTKIRNMRAEESQRLLEFQRMQDKSIDLKNKAAAAEAQERSLRVDMRKLEVHIKELKEQASKMKSMMDQVRAKCVGDVKKRDAEIEKLRTHIAGLQRGKREASINYHTSGTAKREGRKGTEVNNKDWSIERESNDLLSAVMHETTTENVSLRKLLNETIETLRELTGLEGGENQLDETDGIGIPGQYRKSRQIAADIAQANSLVSCETLGERLVTVIEHCRSILKDPSFVPIEEVQIREEEIVKLRVGWEKMADRWREAVIMMGQWKQRMYEEGNSDAAGWSDLSFERSIAVRPDGQPILTEEDGLSSALDHSNLERSEDEQESPSWNEEPESRKMLPEIDEESELELELELEAEPVRKRIASSPARRGVKITRPPHPLQETDGNSSRRDYSDRGPISRMTNISVENSEDTENDTFHNHKARSRILKVSHLIRCMIRANLCLATT